MCKRRNYTEKKVCISESYVRERKSVNYWEEGYEEGLVIIVFLFYIFYIKVC